MGTTVLDASEIVNALMGKEEWNPMALECE